MAETNSLNAFLNGKEKKAVLEYVEKFIKKTANRTNSNKKVVCNGPNDKSLLKHVQPIIKIDKHF